MTICFLRYGAGRIKKYLRLGKILSPEYFVYYRSLSVGQFTINDEDESVTFGFDYDYNSIMHYDAYAFTKSSDKPTIIPTDPTRSYTSIGQREKPTDSDYFKLNALYECNIGILDNLKLSMTSQKSANISKKLLPSFRLFHDCVWFNSLATDNIVYHQQH
ncbi:astacin-like metalloendopeptidase [Hydractinia symbiolongicarpus]|uniref:astacin-like metalloendopeptidase n=1 Tax=Hydractinia symbiolongicarpus TaxID=13093 RepID=UPI00254D9D2D|nr:astacin-like metalloendopeptidase [Hydractinia symbiolongicarpus]